MSSTGHGAERAQASRESPLARFDLARRATDPRTGAGVIARERPFLGHLNLRGDPADARFVDAVASVLGVGLPLVANTTSGVRHAPDPGGVREGDETTVFWLGPDEWLIVTADEGRVKLERELRTALAGMRSAVIDVSGGQSVIVLRGSAVRDVLAKGCPLDLHPRAFGPGRCAQSHLAKSPILVRQVDDVPTFELLVRRSFADYVWTWLTDAAEEYGMEVEA